jgi:hypothetical protein
MNLAEIDANKTDIAVLFRGASEEFDFEPFESAVSINNWVTLRVYNVESSIDRENDIFVKADDGSDCAILCPIGSPGNVFKVGELSIPRLISYVNDVEVNEFGRSDSYSFKSHFLLVRKDFYVEYRNSFEKSSALWGGFTHAEIIPPHRRNVTSIPIRSSIKMPSARHENDLLKAVAASNGFERYLKYYHQIELLFDIIFVAKIKNLPSSIIGFGDVMKDYQRKECDTLKSIFRSYISDPAKILEMLQGCSVHIPIMRSIFQDSGKESNPINDEKWADLLIFIQSSNQSPQAAKDLKFIAKATNEHLLDFVANLLAYWVYRVRCSIAHNREGEFIFEHADEKFVVEFGEALLKEAIQQIFSNEDLKQILS